MMNFIEYEDGEIEIREGSAKIGVLIRYMGRYRLNLLGIYDNSDVLRQIADKLDELNK